ncbi:unnamed protein product, partial [Symbiodinium sp. KB8]
LRAPEDWQGVDGEPLNFDGIDRARPFQRAVPLLLFAVCIAGLSHLQAFSIPELVRQSAQKAQKTPSEFLESIEERADEWQRGTEVAGRENFTMFLEKVMNKPGLHMVIGGKSLGKSKVLERMSTTKFQQQDPLLLVDMRMPPQMGSADVLECLQEVAKSRWTEDTMPYWLQPVMGEFLPVLSKAEARESDQGLKVVAAAAATVAATMGAKKPSQFVEEFVAAASADGLTPVIIIDEASIAFPDGNGGNGNGKKAAAEAALALFVAISKQQRKACVVLVASEYAFPYRIEQLGRGKYDSLNIIVAPEVEEVAMIEMLTTKWGMPEDLAEAFYDNFGGDIFLCSQALSQLTVEFSLGDEVDFDSYYMWDNFGLDDLVMDNLTRQHMENMAKKGWSPIEGGDAKTETPSQSAAREIVKVNFGAVIGRKTRLFGHLGSLKKQMFEDVTTQQVLIPTTQYMRKCIQKMVEAVKQKEDGASRQESN